MDMENYHEDRGVPRSSFSLSHHWIWQPTKIEHPEKNSYAPLRLPMEEVGLQAIGAIGCIGSVQLGRLFAWKRSHIRRMLAEHKLVQHQLRKNRTTIPVFTLGPRAIQLLQSNQTVNSWCHWSVADVLSKLIFFQFACALHEKQKGFQIQASASPFTGKVQMGEHTRYVLILRGQDTKAIERELQRSQWPVIVIAETLLDLKPLNHVLTHAYALMDQDLRKEYTFYRQRGGIWQQKITLVE
ncbi:hypothetical protein QCD85_06035 [Paenibacillus sp. PsM32]|uniref:hypothetical protein n=1 Tax=unclassified Paenibacillus TaxID=185978 RepID=UPI0023657FF4|nr:MULTISPECIES: hypothetical protein [unclassified Paenibacillus]MDN4617649.1 hypothetical protein [Paenibacillus sp. PsM32]WDF52895.1 hypothetical protein PQ460_10915 [Paenibacillus sp. KACC 21273]